MHFCQSQYELTIGKDYFNAQLTGQDTGLTFAMYFIGSLASAPITGPLGDHLGRRWAMTIGSAVTCLGACVQGSAVNSKH